MVNKLNSSHPLYDYLEKISELEKKEKRSTKHKENISKILLSLALNGSSSTWNLSKKFSKRADVQNDKVIRRILKGRKDDYETTDGQIIEQYSDGLLQLKIVENTSNSKYSLTPYGMLYILKSNKFSASEFSQIAKNYKEMFPLIFQKIDYFKKYKIPIFPLIKIANGEFLNLDFAFGAPIPYNEIITYLINEHSKRSDQSFSNFVQLYFFTILMYTFWQKYDNTKKWLQIINNDEDIKSEYSYLINETIFFHNFRNKVLNKVLDSL